MPRCRFGFGFGLGSGSSRRASQGLPASVPLVASGAGISATLQGDGSYLIATTAASVAGTSFVGSADDVFPGDYLGEFEIIVHQTGVGAGFDNAIPAARDYTGMDECFVPDAGSGAGHGYYYNNGVITVGNFLFSGKVYMERVGTVERIYAGANFGLAKAAGAIVTSTAVDGAARSFQFVVNAGAVVVQWKVRVIPHP